VRLAVPTLHHHHPPSTCCPLTADDSSSPSHLSPISDMSQLSSSSSFKTLFGAALQDYETRTGISLVNHPFSKQLEECDSLNSITAILREQSKGFREFRGDNGKLMKSVECSVDVLYILNRYFPAIPACKSHIRWHCHLTRCMLRLFLQSQLHISLTSKFGRR
jgi:hypothetical protein